MRLAAIRVRGESGPWERLGFSVEAGRISLANGSIEPGHIAPGLVVESSELGGADIEGIHVEVGEPPAAAIHANGAIDLDHLVIMTPDLDRTSAAVARVLGLPRRRLRDVGDVRQAFHRFAPAADGTPGCIVELVERLELARPELWGLVVDVVDLDGFAAASDHVGSPRDAVQRGRRIASVRREAGLGVAVALMSPGS